jgi:hypothetical protein
MREVAKRFNASRNPYDDLVFINRFESRAAKVKCEATLRCGLKMDLRDES